MSFSKILKIIAVIAFFLQANSLLAAEIMGVSGFYETESRKVDSRKAGGESEINGQVRYLDALTGSSLAWFADVGLEFDTYESPEGGSSPDNFTGVLAGGGVRKYFSPFNTFTVPFCAAFGHYKNSQTVSYSGTGYTSHKSSGVYYGASVGVRLGLDQKFFLEFELPFFSSPLVATETDETYTPGTGTVPESKVKSEKTKRSLYGSTTASITSILVGVGMKL